MKAHDGMYIDGEWRPATGPDVIEVVNPVDERIVGRVPAGTAEDVDAAVRAARAALPAWAATAPADRAARLAALRDVLAARKDEIAETVTAELGSPLKFSQAVHAAVPIAVAGSYAELAATYAFEEKVGDSVVHQEPVGVVGAITPWNYPLHQIVAKAAPALAAGCTVVLKPAEDTPLVAQLFAEAVHEAGLPAGVFNLVTGLGPVAGQALAEHPDVDLVSFTGSTAVGRQIGATAGAAIKKVALELGGKSPTSSCRARTWPRRSTSASPTSCPTPARHAAPGRGCWCTGSGTRRPSNWPARAAPRSTASASARSSTPRGPGWTTSRRAWPRVPG
ncbi:NAD/NADP-dependent betaine aldehyde dehydrogenase [Streptomyces alboniger]